MMASLRKRWRLKVGALLYDWLPFEFRMLGLLDRSGKAEGWLQIRNRNEAIASNVRGVQCLWPFSSELHIGNVLPWAAARLMGRALTRWPIVMRETPEQSESAPRVSFLIGHRGLDRLPHLLASLRSIAGQTGLPIECIVVEQSNHRQIEQQLPGWVRYVHTPLPRPDLPYCRSWAFNVAARHARSDVLVLQDNDLLVPARYALEAEQRVADGALFVDLKRFLFYLDAIQTARVLTSGLAPVAVPSTVMQNFDGGSVVARRSAYESIGGFDESFVGWGGEDNEFLERAITLGNVDRFACLPLLHLAHAPQPGKAVMATAAIERYHRLQTIDPRERVIRLLTRKQGQPDRPAGEDEWRG